MPGPLSFGWAPAPVGAARRARARANGSVERVRWIIAVPPSPPEHDVAATSSRSLEPLRALANRQQGFGARPRLAPPEGAARALPPPSPARRHDPPPSL